MINGDCLPNGPGSEAWTGVELWTGFKALAEGHGIACRAMDLVAW
jgi:hypothetical protein